MSLPGVVLPDSGQLMGRLANECFLGGPFRLSLTYPGPRQKDGRPASGRECDADLGDDLEIVALCRGAFFT